MDRHHALAMASVVVDLHITRPVNQVCGVHALLPHGALQAKLLTIRTLELSKTFHMASCTKRLAHMHKNFVLIKRHKVVYPWPLILWLD
jgi:hypothetical protein